MNQGIKALLVLYIKTDVLFGLEHRGYLVLDLDQLCPEGLILDKLLLVKL